MLLNTMHGSFVGRETIGQLCSMQGTRLRLLPGFHNPTPTLFSLILSSCVVPSFRLVGFAPYTHSTRPLCRACRLLLTRFSFCSLLYARGKTEKACLLVILAS